MEDSHIFFPIQSSPQDFSLVLSLRLEVWGLIGDPLYHLRNHIVASLEMLLSSKRTRIQKKIELCSRHGRATGLGVEQRLGEPQSLVQKLPPLERFNVLPFVFQST